MPANDDREGRPRAVGDTARFEQQRSSVAKQIADFPQLAAFDNDSDEDHSSHKLVVGAVHMPIRSWRELLVSAAAGVLVESYSSDIVKAGATTAAGMMVTALRSLRKLTAEELLTFTVMQTLSAGAVYRVWVTQDEIVQGLEKEGVDNRSATRSLASMKSRGILEEGAGEWKAVW